MTATTERPNKNALQQALDVFRDAMRPFIVKNLRSVRGRQVEDLILDALNPNQADQVAHNLSRDGGDLEAAIDIGDFPQIVSRNWHDAFGRRFADRSVQSLLWLVKEARDKTAHPGRQDLDGEYARARISLMAEVLGLIGQPDQRRTVETIRDQRLAGPRPSDDRTEKPTKPAAANGRRAPRLVSNLEPWRAVIKPSPDVSQGTFRQAEFAADLQQVHDGRASATEYGNPVSFFNHTYITPGIRTLLVNTLQRLTGSGGDPVIQTKTGFGGGKTHSLIALYHFVNHADALAGPSSQAVAQRTSAELTDIMRTAGVQLGDDFQPRTAVLDGTHLTPTDPSVTEETGDPLNTLWGQMAYQLGGQDAYEMVGTAARQGSAPGGAQLDALFQQMAPCVILIDELVAYVRNAGDAQDNIYTFVQALTQAVRRNDGVALVVTLPDSRAEAGAAGGAEALERLERLLGRIEAVWKPLEANEAFEVVRRRLFGEVSDPAARDRTCQAFAAMYGRSRGDYPREASEQRYLERLKACYPIHPEIFDRLYADWSSIPQFQRTRGVLRLLAIAVSRLYQHDHLPLILPASLPLSDPALAEEFVKLLSQQWQSVLSEVDSDTSRTDDIDQGLQRFAEVGGAARRIARTVFLGSAPSGAVRGVDERQIRLGVVQPGQGVSVYNEALSRMSGRLYYLYANNGRYYFHAEQNLNKVAADRRGELSQADVDAHVVGQLQESVGRRSDVIVCPQSSADVPDAEQVRLVVLPPHASRPTRASENDDANDLALDILLRRGDAPRVRRNTLLFLAARRDEIRDLRNKVLDYLAWQSIVSGPARIENLTGARVAQAKSSLESAERAVRSALVQAYRQALAPVQDDPQHANYRLSAAEIDTADSGGAIADAAFRRFCDDEALVETISPTALATFLQQYVWSNNAYRDHVAVDALWDMLTSNVYMHRLRNGSVLQRAIAQGVPEGAFGYAGGYQAGSYQNLRFREPQEDPQPDTLAERGPGLLVSAEMAELVKAEQPPPVVGPDPPPVVGPDPPPTVDPTTPTTTPITPSPPRPTRIVAVKTLADDISLDEVNQLRDEIIRNLRGKNVELTVQITIRAHKPDGFAENVTRAVRENSPQLGMDYREHA